MYVSIINPHINNYDSQHLLTHINVHMHNLHFLFSNLKLLVLPAKHQNWNVLHVIVT